MPDPVVLNFSVQVSIDADTARLLFGLVQAAALTGAAPERPPSAAWLTDQRKTALIELYPTSRPMSEVRAVLEEIEGPPIGKTQAIRLAASKLGLHRPEGVSPGADRMRAIKAAKRAAASPTGPGRDSASADHAAAGSSTRLPGSAPSAGSPAPAPVSIFPPSDVAAKIDTASSNQAPGELLRERAGGPAPAAHPPRPAPGLGPQPPSVPASPAAAARPAVPPVEATKEYLIQWARARGVDTHKFDLDAINRKAADLGHPGFVLRKQRS